MMYWYGCDLHLAFRLHQDWIKREEKICFVLAWREINVFGESDCVQKSKKNGFNPMPQCLQVLLLFRFPTIKKDKHKINTRTRVPTASVL